MEVNNIFITQFTYQLFYSCKGAGTPYLSEYVAYLRCGGCKTSLYAHFPRFLVGCCRLAKNRVRQLQLSGGGEAVSNDETRV